MSLAASLLYMTIFVELIILAVVSKMESIYITAEANFRYSDKPTFLLLETLSIMFFEDILNGLDWVNFSFVVIPKYF